MTEQVRTPEARPGRLRLVAGTDTDLGAAAQHLSTGRRSVAATSLARRQFDTEQRWSVSLHRLIDLAAASQTGRGAHGPARYCLDTLQDALGATCMAVGASSAALSIRDSDKDELGLALTHGRQQPGPDTRIERRANNRLLAWVAEHRESVCMPMAHEPQSRSDIHWPRARLPDRCFAASPVVHAGRSLGVLQVFDKQDAQAFDETDVVRLELSCYLIAPVLGALEAA